MEIYKILLLLLLVTLVACAPFKEEEEEEPHPPGYEINPHFGFRRYFEMRYEPLSLGMMEYQPGQTYY